jgi:hypothetical protein
MVAFLMDTGDMEQAMPLDPNIHVFGMFCVDQHGKINYYAEITIYDVVLQFDGLDTEEQVIEFGEKLTNFLSYYEH